MEPEVSTNDILRAIQALEGRFDGLEGRFDGLDKKIDDVRDEVVELIQDLSTSTDERFSELHVKIDGVEQRLDAKIERTRAEMPSKEYIDRKFADYDRESSERAERMFVRR